MKKLIALLLALVLPAAACAQTLILPDGITEIAQEAFKGDTSITEVIIPSGAGVIGTAAFADCSSLADVSIPSSVTSIGSDAFDGCAPSLLIQTAADSAAMTYAASNRIDYQADTTYRALLIGQCAYTNETYVLNGPASDVTSMEAALSQHPATPYQCTVMRDLTRNEMVQAISSAYAGAKAQDVSLFYYSGHGGDTGALVGTDFYGLSPANLKILLDRVPGRKIVIVDACHSGLLIGKSLTASTPESFVEGFLSAFTAKSRSTLATDGYYVITAARGTEKSYEMQLSSGRYYGLFTYHLVNGLGYDYYNQKPGTLLADGNGDGVVSIHEAHLYAQAEAYAAYPEQTAQVYPENCTYQSLVR